MKTTLLQKALLLQTSMIRLGKTLAIAESCTGGYLSHLLTMNPGASAYFLGSFVVYSPALKVSLLQVKKQTIENYTTESREVVLEMLAGILSETSADLSLAITGIAGPSGGTEKNPVGSIWIGVRQRGQEPFVRKVIFEGTRGEIIDKAASICLDQMLFCLACSPTK